MPPTTRSILPRKPSLPQTNTPAFSSRFAPPRHAILAAAGSVHRGDSGSGSAMSSFLDWLSSLSIGYEIAVVVGFLVLLVSLLLASYFCFRRVVGGGGEGPRSHSARHGHGRAASSASSSGHISITVPRVIFVADDSDSPGSSSRGAAAASSPVGLDPAVIASYPKVPFCRAAAAGAGAEAACSICLCEYCDGEMQRVMPECRHRFHLMCLDAWLRRSASCPVCRSSPIPTPVTTPLATPLSELVPLSQYAADRRRHR